MRREGPMRASDVLEIGRQVALALGEAERMKLVHRDIKPLNLMVDRSQGRLAVKVIDFGLVKSTDTDPLDPGLTENGWVGTVHFASPEQLREKPVDIRSDFYSLGASMWFALRGRAPFEGSRAEIIAGHLKGIDREQVPHPALLWLLALNPEDRPANAAVLEDFLREQLSLSESGARHLSVAGDHSRGGFRRWLIFALVAALGAAGLVWVQNSQLQIPTLAALFPRWIRGGLPLQEGELDLTPDELVERARALYFDYSEGKNDRAISLLLRALQLDPNHLMARATLANAYCQRYLRFEYGREWLDNAAREVERLLETHPDSAAAYAAAGLVRYSQGQLREALRMQRRAAKLDDLDPRNHRNLAITLRERGQLEEALSSAERACAIDKDTAINWSIRGSILKALQRDQEAIQAYEQSAHLNMSVPEPVLGLAHIRLLRGELDLASQEVERANRAGHRDLPETCSLQAQIALARGKLSDAEVALRRAVKASPSGNPYHFGGIRYKSLLGYVLLRRGGAAEEANTLLNEALKLDLVEVNAGSENPVFHYSLAATLAAQSQWEAARARLATARQLGWRDERSLRLDPRLQRLLSDR
ncbi:MAG: protein kinase [Verrucomicrobia bacterium]|nr:protein kinase [Verrucomicrobiota bacterium]